MGRHRQVLDVWPQSSPKSTFFKGDVGFRGSFAPFYCFFLPHLFSELLQLCDVLLKAGKPRLFGSKNRDSRFSQLDPQSTAAPLPSLNPPPRISLYFYAKPTQGNGNLLGDDFITTKSLNRIESPRDIFPVSPAMPSHGKI